VEVTLKKHHTHAGEKKKPGDKIDVDATTAKWLADCGVIDKEEISSGSAGKTVANPK